MQKIVNWILGRMGLQTSRPAVSFDDAAAREMHRKKLGRLGEEAAAKRLLQSGYRILERNYLCRSGEIDIIAEHQGQVVFVEVKTRSPRAWDTPESAVTSEKQARIIRAAAYYLGQFRHRSPVRYDIVGVITGDDDEIQSVEIRQNAFGPQTA
jgi:putative endonuclease